MHLRYSQETGELLTAPRAHSTNGPAPRVMIRFQPGSPADKIWGNRRLTWFAGGVLLWGLAILGKLISLQVLHHEDYLRQARQQQIKTTKMPATRGSIYDRSGRLLAMSVPLESVYVNPLRVPDLHVASELLSSFLGMDREALYSRMKWYADSQYGFMWVKRRISPQEAERLRSLKLEWIEFETETQRHYPKDGVAAHVLGSVDHSEKGNAGIERSLNGLLGGRPGETRSFTDGHRRSFEPQPANEPQAGVPITLTIDERLQFVAERELADAVRNAHAKTGSVVVMNPYTGDILVMASYPGFDPNKPPLPGADPKVRFNQAVSVPFEPGSVFKVITLATALETTKLRPESLINCGNGAITLYGRTIHEAKHGYGIMPLEMVLVKSSNIGAIQIGMQVGQKNLCEYVRRFGFGQPTGLPLPAESAGMVRRLSRWGKTSLSSVAMGHEVSTTTVQLAQAAAAVANGGLLVKPRLVLKKGNENTAVEAPRRILQPETAITMRRMMEQVVINPAGTGRRARLDGYTSGGKTGSAQIYDFAAKHYTHNYNASFMGFAPVTNPAIVVIVTVNGTRTGGAGFGGVVAAPVFKSVAEEALRILDIPKDLPDTVPPAAAKAQAEDLDDVAIAGLGDDEPVLEEPGETTATGPSLPIPALPAATAGGSAEPVPDFRGKTLRAVVEDAAAKGLPVLLDGNGVARVQDPPPGSQLHPGERIRVQFSR